MLGHYNPATTLRSLLWRRPETKISGRQAFVAQATVESFHNDIIGRVGLALSDAKRLRALEDENGKSKRLLAVAIIANAGLRDLL